jgi:hypothetical protein
MMFLVGIASTAFVSAIFILQAWHGSLDVRVAPSRIYFAIGTVSASGASLLFWPEKNRRR